MKERPILFNAPMVRALLDGSKTQTRRAVKLPPNLLSNDITLTRLQNGYAEGKRPVFGLDDEPNAFSCVCPYGQPGERLWVREAYRFPKSCDELPPRSVYDSEGRRFVADEVTGTDPGFGKYRPGMFMPRWASRINLEITGVRVERLQDISETDALAEGVDFLRHVPDVDETLTAKQLYECLWESINGPGSWAANPWVWALSFSRVTP